MRAYFLLIYTVVVWSSFGYSAESMKQVHISIQSQGIFFLFPPTHRQEERRFSYFSLSKMRQVEDSFFEKSLAQFRKTLYASPFLLDKAESLHVTRREEVEERIIHIFFRVFFPKLLPSEVGWTEDAVGMD
jgi:hypothetical protein